MVTGCLGCSSPAPVCSTDFISSDTAIPPPLKETPYYLRRASSSFAQGRAVFAFPAIPASLFSFQLWARGRKRLFLLRDLLPILRLKSNSRLGRAGSSLLLASPQHGYLAERVPQVHNVLQALLAQETQKTGQPSHHLEPEQPHSGQRGPVSEEGRPEGSEGQV